MGGIGRTKKGDNDIFHFNGNDNFDSHGNDHKDDGNDYDNNGNDHGYDSNKHDDGNKHDNSNNHDQDNNKFDIHDHDDTLILHHGKCGRGTGVHICIQRKQT